MATEDFDHMQSLHLADDHQAIINAEQRGYDRCKADVVAWLRTSYWSSPNIAHSIADHIERGETVGWSDKADPSRRTWGKNGLPELEAVRDDDSNNGGAV